MFVTLVELLLCLMALLVLVPVSVLFVQILMALPAADRAAGLPRGRRPSIAVIVPAHNEAPGIQASLRSISSQLATGDRLIVVADNCTDSTAKVAASAGAEVLERWNTTLRGKGYALDLGVRHLERDSPQVVVIIDADCRVAPGALDRLARACVESGRPAQALDLMLAPDGAGLRTRIMEFAWLLKNQVRPLGFHKLGLPCQLKGTGMAFPSTVIRSAALATGSIVEDLELGIRLARQGTPALFCPEARVTSYFPRSATAVASQRKRWEHGHLAMILSAALPLFLKAVLCRNRDLLALALDLSVPPLAMLLLTALSVFAASVLFAAGSGLLAPVWISSLSLLMLLLAVVLAWLRHGRHVLSFVELLSGPMYALWKLPLYLTFFALRKAEWVRSARDTD